jgi:exonuclease SbcC
VEAINTIQDDFARILVITHIDELRDAFPNRIEVVKNITGSTLSVV